MAAELVTQHGGTQGQSNHWTETLTKEASPQTNWLHDGVIGWFINRYLCGWVWLNPQVYSTNPPAEAD